MKTAAPETIAPTKSAQIFPIFPDNRGKSTYRATVEGSEGMADYVVFSHLRWDFVFQRPQHLLTRFAKETRVYYVEEPIFHENIQPRLSRSARADGLCVMTPELPGGHDEAAVNEMLKTLVDGMIASENIERFVAWYYTPMALPFTRHLEANAIVFDCMDELSLFKGAHPRLLDYEREIFGQADVVFTGGQSLYDHKKHQHHNIHAMPSSIDTRHFGRARAMKSDPADQAAIPHLRVGFAGVIDERLDIDLLAGAAALRPNWHFVMIGPVVKIDPATLPKLPNIHYLGGKAYDQLPEYISGWDVAMLPFARNESTRFISPTKTPEYLAGGRPVVSTSIRDVVVPYGVKNLVQIADAPREFVLAIERALTEKNGRWLSEVDAFLGQNSWDRTWGRMRDLVEEALDANEVESPKIGRV